VSEVLANVSDRRSPLLQRAAWALVALLAAILLHSIFESPIGWAPTTIVVALGLAAAIRPYAALLLFAGVAPLAGVIFVITRVGNSGFHFEEAVTLAFIAGWSARRTFNPRPLAVPAGLRAAVWLLVAATLASAIVTTAIAAAQEPGASTWQFVVSLLAHDYLVHANALEPAMLFWEGLLLLLIAADTCAGDIRKRDAAVRMFVLGAAGVASLNLLRLVLAAATREDAWSAFLVYFTSARVSVQYSDVNAAGSYFALASVVAVALALRSRLATFCSVLTLLGLWVSGSRTALAAVLIVLAIVPLATNRRLRRPRPILAAVALLAVAAAGAWWWYPQGRNATIEEALNYRVLMARTAFQLVSSDPIFGVGLGRFFPLAAPYIGRAENAHNNFLQVAAELGLTGLALFLTVLALCLRQTRYNESRVTSNGLLAGLSAFLITSLTGHPLLIPSVAHAFWIAAGLAAVPAGTVQPMTRTMHRAAWALGVFFILTLPIRTVAAVRNANLEHASIGLSKWQRDAEGSRYRWAGGRSAFFVPSSASAVRFRLRHGGTGPQEIEVQIFLDGREANGVRLYSDAGWQDVRLPLARESGVEYSRVDLHVRVPGTTAPLDLASSDARGVLMVGRPEIER
jgi:O-antigen ligase